MKKFLPFPRLAIYISIAIAAAVFYHQSSATSEIEQVQSGSSIEKKQKGFAPSVVKPMADISTPIETQGMNAIASIRNYATGFRVGQDVGIRTLYVFFDAQCIYCARLWEQTQTLSDKAQFVWIPVQAMNTQSIRQGAKILASENPENAMTLHESLLTNKRGGLPVASNEIDNALYRIIERNTQVWRGLNGDSVPLMVGVGSDGAIKTITGAIGAQAISAQMGWTQVDSLKKE